MSLADCFRLGRYALPAALLSLSLLVPDATHASPRQLPEAAQRAPVITLEGELQVLIEDYEERPHHRRRHFVETAQGPVEVRFRGRAPDVAPGSRVRVHAERSPGEGWLEADGSGVELLSADLATTTSVLPNTLGEQRVGVILVNFHDDTSQPTTLASARQLVIGQVGDFVRENSFQQTWLSGNSYGWFTIPVSRSICDIHRISQEADSAASAAGVPMHQFDRIVYMFPRNACGWSGGAYIGGSRVWINGSFNLRVVAHELGHSFGLDHSNGLNCNKHPTGDSCTVLGYGDVTDTMGSRAAHFNAFQKSLLGWLDHGHSPAITTVGSSGRYVIEGYAANSDGPKAIRVPRDIDPQTGAQRWFYVEYRQPVGFDFMLGYIGNLAQGVLVRLGTDGARSSSRLLDMTPNSVTSSGFSDLEDGALGVGQTFTDAATGISLSLAWIDGGHAAIDVSLNGGGGGGGQTCTRATPNLSLAGGLQAVAPGTSVDYSVDLGNRDSAGCASTTFTVTPSVPAGWSVQPSSLSYALSPGTSASGTIRVTSPASATGGTYPVAAAASCSRGSACAAQASASYQVQMQPISGEVSTDKAVYAAGDRVTLTAEVLSAGQPVAGATVSFDVAGPDGSSNQLTATSDSAGRATAVLRLNRKKDPPGSYAVQADIQSNGRQAQAHAGFSVR